MRYNGRGSRERVNAGLPREGGRCQEKPSRKESGIFVKKTRRYALWNIKPRLGFKLLYVESGMESV